MKLKKIISRSFFYIFSDIFSKIIPFAFLPFITNSLGPSEFGSYSIFLVTVLAFYVIVGFSTYNYLNIVFFSSENWQKVLSQLLQFWVIGTTIIIVIAYLLNIETLYIYSILAALCMWIFQMLIVVLQFTEKILQYAIFQFIRAVFISLSQVIPIFYGFSTSEDLILSYIIFWLILNFIVCIYLFKNKFFSIQNFDFNIIVESHKFSLPLVINNSSAWVRTSLDRFFILHYLGSFSVGVYALGFQLGGILGMIGLSLTKSFNFFILKELGNKELNAIQKERRVLQLIFIVTLVSIVLFILFILFFKYIFTYFFDYVNYKQSLYISYIIAFAFTIQTICSCLVPIIQFYRKNNFLIYSSVLIFLFSLVLIFWFIPNYGVIGAAMGFLFSWIIYLLLLIIFVKYIFVKHKV